MGNVHHFAAEELTFGPQPFVGMAAPAATAARGTVSSNSGTSYKVTTLKGTHQGIGGSVSGSGASARITGSFSFTTRVLDHSQQYQSLVKKYHIEGGTSGFWSFLVGHASAGASKEEIQQALHDLTQENTNTGTINFDLRITGQIPNFQIDASAYVLILSVTDDQGNNYQFASSSNPQGDTGATNTSASSPDQQPVVTDNNSTINI